MVASPLHLIDIHSCVGVLKLYDLYGSIFFLDFRFFRTENDSSTLNYLIASSSTLRVNMLRLSSDCAPRVFLINVML